MLQQSIQDLLPLLIHLHWLLIVVQLPGGELLHIGDVVVAQEAHHCFETVLWLQATHFEQVGQREVQRNGSTKLECVHVRHLLAEPVHVHGQHTRHWILKPVSHFCLCQLALRLERTPVRWPILDCLRNAHQSVFEELQLCPLKHLVVCQ